MTKTETYQVKEGWVELVSGTRFYFESPTDDMIHPEDVAHSLSKLCRYNGHTKRFYSVAEHACVMSDWVIKQPWATPRDGLTALHHDDPEYIIGDLITPIKVTMPQFKKLEIVLSQALAHRFMTEWPFPDWIKETDNRIIKDERRSIMNLSINEWGIEDLEPLNVKFMPISGRSSKLMAWQWMRRHKRLSAMVQESNRRIIFGVEPTVI